jgi:hypothetical protein
LRLRLDGSCRAARIFVLLVLVSIGMSSKANAQEVCGTGTTFTVAMPSVSGGPGDTITLPDGCRIYALFVSGYERNQKLDELTFYRLATTSAEEEPSSGSAEHGTKRSTVRTGSSSETVPENGSTGWMKPLV